jgi:methyl-accepting chemotaxis protein
MPFINKDLEKQHIEIIQKRADSIIQYFVIVFFIFGILYAPVYQTWNFALGVGSFNLCLFLIARFLVKNPYTARMLMSFVLSIFVLQFISQSHGMAEFHFFFFTNIVLLILYQDWRIMVPYTLSAIVHHSYFFYFQLMGVQGLGIYFINYTNVTLYTLGFHYGLVILMGIICGWWAIELKKQSLKAFYIQKELEDKINLMDKNLELAVNITQGIFVKDFMANDKIGNYLLQLQNKLIESDKKKQEEKFKNEGLLIISKILRDNTDLKELAKQLLSAIIKQINIQQGAIFLVNIYKEEQYLYPLVFQSYSKEQKARQRIMLGEGILGTAVEKKEIIYLDNIPTDYAKVRSGLGETSIKTLLIVPLVFNQKIIGAIELGSLFKIDDYKINFVKTVTENIVSTILAIQASEENKRLLIEAQNMNAELKTREEELLTQEEELKQNMEEMQTTQDELQRKQAQLEAEVESVNNAKIIRIEFTPDGYIKAFNPYFCEIFGYSEEELFNQHHSILVPNEYKNSKEYQVFWQNLRNGVRITQESERLDKNGKSIFVNGSYVPVMDKYGKVESILKLAVDITETKKMLINSQEMNNELLLREEELRQNMEEMQAIQDDLQRKEKLLQKQVQDLSTLQSELNARIQALGISSILSEADIYGNILYINDKLLEVTGYTKDELIGKPHNILRHPDMPKQLFEVFWKTIKAGKIFRGIIKNKKKDGTHYWVDAVISPVIDENGNVLKYIGIRYLIENEEIAKNLFINKCKELNINLNAS